VAFVDQLGHLAKEEREQERTNVTAVDVGVGQQNNLVVANLGDVEIGFDAGTDRRDQA